MGGSGLAWAMCSSDTDGVRWSAVSRAPPCRTVEKTCQLSVVVLIQVIYPFQIEWMNGYHVNIHY